MWTLFLYTARSDEFKFNNVNYLLVFIESDYNNAILDFEKELSLHPLRAGYEISTGPTKEEVWDKSLKEHLGSTFIPFKKIMSLSQTLVMKKDLRCKNGYKISKGNI